MSNGARTNWFARTLTRTWHATRSLASHRRSVGADLVAGIPGAISSVPDGMAASVLVGVNPVYGLYASITGPVAGGVTSSTRLMVITTTSAAALAAGSALSDVSSADRPRSLFLLTLLAGVAMVLAAVFRLGRLTRFVPHSVMIGFLSGVALNIVLGQLPDLFGAEASGAYPLAKAVNLVLHPSAANAASSAAGLSALAILVVVNRTRVRPFSSLVALVVPSVVVAVAGGASVPLVSDAGAIPSGLPAPVLPHLSDFSVSVLIGALSVAAVVLVQGAGVSESVPNPDGSRANPDRDFLAQGVANLASGIFRGQPVGGSVGRTALNVAAGARSRWASVFSGCWLAVILIAFSGIVGYVVMSTLAAILIVAAAGSLRTGELRAILRTGRISQVAVTGTFVATLFLPVAAAVGMGLVISLLMQMNQDAVDLRVVRLEPLPGGGFRESRAPKELVAGQVVLLDVYGSLFYAGARTLQALLPDPILGARAAVVIRLRGRATLGATAFAVLTDYAHRLDDVGGRLYLSGIDPSVFRQIHRNRTVESAGVRLYVADAVIGEASLHAFRDAERWSAHRV